MDISSNDYFRIINEKVLSLSGFNSQSKWEQCFRTNSTYLDCPVSKMSSLNYTMAVAIQNPSTLDLNNARIAVPNGNYILNVFDS